MPNYYDDNYGHYEIESQDDIDFYRQVQKESVYKKCKGCGRKVRIMPNYAYCNSCMERLESGRDLY